MSGFFNLMYLGALTLACFNWATGGGREVQDLIFAAIFKLTAIEIDLDNVRKALKK